MISKCALHSNWNWKPKLNLIVWQESSVIFVNENENENEKDKQFVHENEN